MRVPGGMSGWQPVTSGASQGSISGPVLFNVFISDLVSALESVQRMFVDDAKLVGAADSLKGKEILTK